MMQAEQQKQAGILRRTFQFARNVLALTIKWFPVSNNFNHGDEKTERHWKYAGIAMFGTIALIALLVIRPELAIFVSVLGGSMAIGYNVFPVLHTIASNLKTTLRAAAAILFAISLPFIALGSALTLPFHAASQVRMSSSINQPAPIQRAVLAPTIVQRRVSDSDSEEDNPMARLLGMRGEPDGREDTTAPHSQQAPHVHGAEKVMPSAPLTPPPSPSPKPFLGGGT
ncbi:MAG: hypothetical protein DHS20C10_05950 [marine bacterium B5-7]|nr:MAG: hypothetical protein DHS20C10_05950 [marine bacterium B5-7]